MSSYCAQAQELLHQLIPLQHDEESWDKWKHGEVNKKRNSLHRVKISPANLYKSGGLNEREKKAGGSQKPNERHFNQPPTFPNQLSFMASLTGLVLQFSDMVSFLQSALIYTWLWSSLAAQ